MRLTIRLFFVEAIPYDIDFSVEEMNGDDIKAVIRHFFGDGSV